MNLQDYLALRNGSDVRGVATEGITGEGVTLTKEGVKNIARAFCLWLAEKSSKDKLTIAVGHDSRISAEELCSAVVEGITSTGNDVVVTGLSTTPSMFMLLKDASFIPQCHGSIMITASHLPFHRNGLKFFSPTGGLEGEDVKKILTAAAEEYTDKEAVGAKFECSYLNGYAATLVNMVREATGEEKPLLGKKIIVDAGNGAGGFFTEKVLQPLGADTTGSQFLEPDGMFPNHIPNPENKEAMRSVCAAVKAANADFGIIFDTDVDRAGAVDKNGEEINRNRLIALISGILLQEKSGTIVTDSVTSDGLAKFITEHGGRHHRFKRGYKNVINEAIRLNEAGEYTPLAIETSGHAALMENYFLDDGAYLVTRLLIALAKEAKQGRTLTDIIANLELPQAEIEIRPRFVDSCDFKKLGQRLLQDFEQYAKKLPYVEIAKDNYEGCRVSFDEKHGGGWLLIRMSLHEPILPVNIECKDVYGSLQITKELYYFLKKYPFIQLAPVEKTISDLRSTLIDGAKNKI